MENDPFESKTIELEIIPTNYTWRKWQNYIFLIFGATLVSTAILHFYEQRGSVFTWISLIMGVVYLASVLAPQIYQWHPLLERRRRIIIDRNQLTLRLSYFRAARIVPWSDIRSVKNGAAKVILNLKTSEKPLVLANLPYDAYKQLQEALKTYARVFGFTITDFHRK